MMFKCECCGEIFEEPNRKKYCVGYYGSAPAYDTESTCPHCGEDNFDEYNEGDEEDEDNDEL